MTPSGSGPPTACCASTSRPCSRSPSSTACTSTSPAISSSTATTCGCARRPGFLHRIDAATNTVAEHVEPPEAVSGGSVLPTEDAVWLTESDDNVLLRLKRDA